MTIPNYNLDSRFLPQSDSLKKKKKKRKNHCIVAFHLSNHSKITFVHRSPFQHTSFFDYSFVEQKRCNFLSLSLSHSITLPSIFVPSLFLSFYPHYFLVDIVQGIRLREKRKEKKRNSHGIFRTILTDLTLKLRRVSMSTLSSWQSVSVTQHDACKGQPVNYV